MLKLVLILLILCSVKTMSLHRLLLMQSFSDCSGSYTAKDQASTLTLPVTQFPTTCRAQIAADKKKFVYASVGTQTPKSILLYDGGSVAAPQIGDFHTGTSTL